MADTPEAKVKRWLTKQLTSEFPNHWRYMAPGGRFGKAGTPDYLVCIDGLFVVIEAKSDVGKVTPSQIHQLQLLKKAGAVCCVMKGKDQEKFNKLVAVIRNKLRSMQ